MQLRTSLVLLAAAGAALSSASRADITSVGLGGQLIARPADARQGVLTSMTSVYCWNEEQNRVLTAPLAVDAAEIGAYPWLPFQTTYIPAGTRISSHYVHFESPNGAIASSAIYLEFDAPILGVIASGDSDDDNDSHHLNDSDYLGMGTQFPWRLRLRGMEPGQPRQDDRLFIWPDGHSVQLVFSIDSPGDFVRIITAASPCYANCDGSTTAPILNVNDFICFQSRFAAGDTYANCDQSTTPPVLNVNDFICFQTRFAAGCP